MMCIECDVVNYPGRQPQSKTSSVHQALRLVIAIAMDEDEAASCMGRSSDEATSQWPSSLYASVARAAIESPLVWRRCCRLLDNFFRDHGSPCDHLGAIEISRRFLAGRPVLSTWELAAMLWSLLRRSQPTLEQIIERLGAELEITAALRSARPNNLSSSMMRVANQSLGAQSSLSPIRYVPGLEGKRP